MPTWVYIVGFVVQIGLAVFGAVAAFGGAYFGRRLDADVLESKRRMRSELADRKLRASVRLMTLFNNVGANVDFFSYGVAILDGRPGRPSDKPSTQHHGAAVNSLEAFYRFVGRHSVILGADTMRTFFWFRTRLYALQLLAETDQVTAELGGAARETMIVAQRKFSKNVEKMLQDAGVTLMEPDEISKINSEAAKDIYEIFEKAQKNKNGAG